VRTHRPTPNLPEHLEALYRAFPFDRSLADDPISAVRPLVKDPRSGEVAALFAAVLAVGNTTAIRGTVARLAKIAEGDFAGFVTRLPPSERRRRLATFRHRWIRGDQVDFLAGVLARYYATHSSLEEAFLDGYGTGGFAAGIDSLARTLRGDLPGRPHGKAPRGYRILFPSPLEVPRSPCKRLTLFVRWMVRDRYPDLGLWHRVPTGELRVPLDLHVHWIAYHIGLTPRKTRSWAAVEEVTEALRRIDPLDPTRYDFVLCHTGISGDCPKERDFEVCGPCTLRPDCLMWRGRKVAS
jgi:uncharacterized protein (TIGR02757 family)